MKTCKICGKIYPDKGINSHLWRTHGKGKNFVPNPFGSTGMKGKKLSDERKQYLKEMRLGKKLSNATKEKISKKLKSLPNIGGYKKGGGRGKHGWYKGYWCDSSWELAYVIYNLEHNIQFKRNTEKFKYVFENNDRNYIPDFIEDSKYVEIKGYNSNQFEAKKKYFKKKLVILDKKGIEKYINYVVSKYGKDFIKLYDGELVER